MMSIKKLHSFDRSYVERILLAVVMKGKNLAHTHIESFNDLIETGMEQVITRNFKIEGTAPARDPKKSDKSFNKGIDHIKYSGKFINVKIYKPKHNNTNTSSVVGGPIYPNEAIITRNFNRDCPVVQPSYNKICRIFIKISRLRI